MSKNLQEYWRKNISIVAILLCIWAIVSYGLGIFFVVPMNKIRMGGFPLGFWFAQQGSIYVFVALIFIYYKYMSKLDRDYDVHE